MTSIRTNYGPWALVTGASSGLGAAFARRLAAADLNVVLVARREARLRSLATELHLDHRVETRVVPSDLSETGFLNVIEEATGDLDVGLLINNAGIAPSGPFLEHDLDTELAALNLNVRAPLVLAHHFGRLMRSRGRGGIVFVASIVGLAGVPGWSHYAATKSHNLVLAEGLGEELRSGGVDVLALAPGFMRTELVELSSLGLALSLEPRFVAERALVALGRKRTVTPGLVHRLIAWSTRLQPRRLSARVFGAVVAHAEERPRRAGADRPGVGATG